MPSLNDSLTIMKYKETLKKYIRLYYDRIDESELDKIIDYSISKRYQSNKAEIDNNYTKEVFDTTLLGITDYILENRPVVTSFGTMFMNHITCPNPMANVVKSFMDLRNVHKKEMFKFPKGSANFEKFNLLQQLDKIDANGIYGVLGLYTALLYNVNVATTITSMGRTMVSSMCMFFEMFLNDNVQFGSTDEVLSFIDNIKSERSKRIFDDMVILDNFFDINIQDVFYKIVKNCTWRWTPSELDLDIIWRALSNLDQQDLNRIWYKNNLFEFCENTKVFNIIRTILKKLKQPLMNSLEVPEEIADNLKELSNLIFEYVYYPHMVIDRVDKCDNMIKSVVMVLDTDSNIVSLDGWYRYISEKVAGEEFEIASYDTNTITEEKTPAGPYYDYDFNIDDIIERDHMDAPEVVTSNDNMRYSIINILANILDRCVNNYMELACINHNSVYEDPEKPGELYRHSKIIAKTEFLFNKLMMTTVKKNYASIQAVQEGNLVPYDKQLDIKGIECLTKSSKSIHTRQALQKILLEDVLRTSKVDQLRFIKDIAIFEKRIVKSVQSGSKEYFKPMVVKSMAAYADPMHQQGIKASLVWNAIKPSSLPSLNMDERNAVDIAKVVINKVTAENIKEKFPEVYENCQKLFEDQNFADGADCIAIPLDTETPDWLLEFVDYNAIIENNIAGFPYESLGIKRLEKDHVTWTNILQL